MYRKTSILSATIIYLFSASFADGRRTAHPFFEGLPPDRAWVVAHRGGKALWPENTLHAFGKALEAGAHVLEMDVRVTADGIPVIIHDNKLDRTTNGTGRVGDFTLRELRRLDAAYHWSSSAEPDQWPYRGAGLTIPALEEVFNAFPEAHMVIEIKESGKDRASVVGELIKRYNREDRTMVASFQTPLLRSFRASYPGVATSAGRSEVRSFWLLRKLFLHGLIRPDYVALQVPERSRGRTVMTPGFVETARRKQISVQVWTVNKKEDMERLLDMGINALITDEPLLALKVTKKYFDRE
ncbi:MAG: glycerophosphodiester phosphodiesterase [Syntrophales bacterium]|nr:glycerophosphodiester phosphodiesterase [Syntrophales bacterium]